jgi:hypothetical protein
MIPMLRRRRRHRLASAQHEELLRDRVAHKGLILSKGGVAPPASKDEAAVWRFA